MFITRKQLKSFGATDYLVKRLTQALQPDRKKGRLYEYNTKQVLNSICSLRDTLKIRKTTKVTLAHLEIKVSSLIGSTNNSRLLEAMRRASEANTQFEQTADEARKIAKEFQDSKREYGINFSPKNNIVAFIS